MMLDRGALEQLDREALIALALAQQAQIAALGGQVAALAARVEELGGRPPGPPPAAPPLPAFVKPARPVKARQGGRKRRGQGFGRRRMAPTRTVEHALDACPDCGAALAGGEAVRRRQVLHIPPAPVEVIEHVARRRVCPQCGRAHTPPLDLGDAAFGQQRVSADTLAYIAALRAVGRLPLRAIQWLLAARHGLRLSLGGLAGLLRAVAERAQPALDELRARVRGSPVVNADETGWREDGANGYVWFFGTPELRYFHRDASRGGAVVREVLGEDFGGVLVSDFYAAYTHYEGRHQYCWAHLLRDVHDLVTAHPRDGGVRGWAEAVHALFTRARGLADPDPAARHRAARAFERELAALCAPYLPVATPASPPGTDDGTETAAPGSAPALAIPVPPQRTLCQRIDRHLAELFVFVAEPAVPPTNNAAERSLRHLVVSRKISGGTRSEDGSTTKMALASVFGTWRAQGLNPFAECRRLLASPQG
jgi:transposase